VRLVASRLPAAPRVAPASSRSFRAGCPKPCVHPAPTSVRNPLHRIPSARVTLRMDWPRPARSGTGVPPVCCRPAKAPLHRNRDTLRTLNISNPPHKNNFFGRIKSEQPGLTRMNVNAAAPLIQQSNNLRPTPFAYLAYFAVQFLLCVHSSPRFYHPSKKSVGSRSRNRSTPQNRSMMTMVLRGQKNADPLKIHLENHQSPVIIEESHFMDPPNRVRCAPYAPRTWSGSRSCDS